MKFPKSVLFLTLVLAASLALAGCMRGGDNDAKGGDAGLDPSAAAAPYATADLMPRQTAYAASPAAFDWNGRVSEVEDAISHLSEVKEDRVIVSGNTALVGVRFDGQYQGEMTERIREMVASSVLQADPSITTVAVTADEKDVGDIFDMARRIAGGEAVSGMEEDVQRIVRNASTLR